MVVRTVRFVLLLLVSVAAFGAIAGHAKAAAEVSDEPNASNSNKTITEVVSSHEAVENHEAVTTTSVVGDAVAEPSKVEQPVNAPTIQDKDTSIGSSNVAQQNAPIEPVLQTQLRSSSSYHSVHSVQTGSAQPNINNETQLQPVAIKSANPNPTAPASLPSNPLMTLMGFGLLSAQSVLTQLSQATFAITATHHSTPTSAGVGFVVIVIVSVGIAVSLMRRTGYAHAARAGLNNKFVAITSYMQPSLLPQQSSVFSCFGNNKKLLINNQGGLI